MMEVLFRIKKPFFLFFIFYLFIIYLLSFFVVTVVFEKDQGPFIRFKRYGGIEIPASTVSDVHSFRYKKLYISCS